MKLSIKYKWGMEWKKRRQVKIFPLCYSPWWHDGFKSWFKTRALQGGCRRQAQSVPPGSEEISSLIAQKQVALKGAILLATAAKCAPSLEVSGFQL